MPEAKNSVVKKEESKKDKFDWADEGLSALVRVVILSWSAAILTLNYVTILCSSEEYRSDLYSFSVLQERCDFSVTPAKKKDDSDSAKKEDDKKTEFDYEFEVVFDKEKETTIQKNPKVGLKNKNHLLMLFAASFLIR